MLSKQMILNLSVSGSGKLYTADITVSDALDCSISGSGDIILREAVTWPNADISISGSGNYYR